MCLWEIFLEVSQLQTLDINLKIYSPIWLILLSQNSMFKSITTASFLKTSYKTLS